MVERKCEYPGCNFVGDPENFEISFLSDTPVNVAEDWENPDVVARGNWYCKKHLEETKKERGV